VAKISQIRFEPSIKSLTILTSEFDNVRPAPTWIQSACRAIDSRNYSTWRVLKRISHVGVSGPTRGQLRMVKRLPAMHIDATKKPSKDRIACLLE
jgi:hypothetical protein